MTAKTNAHVQEAVNLLNNSGFAQFDDVKVGQELVGETAVVRPLHVSQFTISYLIGERDSGQNIEQETLNNLASKLQTNFNDEELKALCFTLSMPYEDMGSQTHSGRMVALVQYAKRRGRLADLAAYGRQHRPHIAWPRFPIMKPTPIVDKKDLAIVVSLAQPALEKAAEFLAKEQIDANILLITNVPAYNHKLFLSIEQDWDQVAHNFGRTMDIVSRKFSQANRHFFIAGPMPLIFAMGCVWGTVHTGDKLYHLDRGIQQYVHVLTSSQKWLSP